MEFDLLIRKFVPSTSRLTFNPLFKVFSNSFDILPRLMFSEFRALPPNHMRIRVGVGNRIFFNHARHHVGARSFFSYALDRGLCSLDSVIVDIGCGCGRYAQVMNDYKFKAETFTGRYIGVDIDEEMLRWCEQHLDAERFRFHLSSDKSASYFNEGSSSGPYVIPEPDESVDLVFSTSLYTHLLEEELINYTRESFRLLKPGAYMAANCFCLDHPPPTFGGRHTFAHQLGNAKVESLSQPEAAVAYTDEYLLGVARDIGFESCEILAGAGVPQPMLICHKP